MSMPRFRVTKTMRRVLDLLPAAEKAAYDIVTRQVLGPHVFDYSLPGLEER